MIDSNEELFQAGDNLVMSCTTGVEDDGMQKIVTIAMRKPVDADLTDFIKKYRLEDMYQEMKQADMSDADIARQFEQPGLAIAQLGQFSAVQSYQMQLDPTEYPLGDLKKNHNVDLPDDVKRALQAHVQAVLVVPTEVFRMSQATKPAANKANARF